MAYAAVSIEGGLLSPEVLDHVAAGSSDVPGQRTGDFGLGEGRRPMDEIQSAFSDARAYWEPFQRRLNGHGRAEPPSSNRARA